MNKRLIALLVASALVGLALTTPVVCAQTARPARPYRSLFGSDSSSRPSLHNLNLTVSFNGAFDNGMASPDSASGATPAKFQDLYSATAALVYVLRGKRVGVELSSTGNLPYNPRSAGNWRDMVSYASGAAISVSGDSTSFRTNGGYTYTPYYSLSLAAAGAPGPSIQPFDYSAERNPNEQTSAGATLTQHFGKRTSASAGYLFNRSWFATDGRSSHSQDALLSIDRQLFRSFSVRGSYAYREGFFDTAGTPSTSRSQDVDVGLVYTSLSTRGSATSIIVLVGSSFAREQPAQPAKWRGSARVSRTFGQRWTAGAAFSRSLQFNSVLQQPVWADVANADLAGRFGRRVNLSMSASYSNGQRASLPGSSFDIYSGAARLQIGLASFAAIDAQYTYYRYSFPAGYQLPASLPSRMDRQRAQVGVSFWVPFVRAGRASEPRSRANQ